MTRGGVKVANRIKRGHFVPQCYLRAFANPDKASQIFVLRRQQPTVTLINPIARVASRTGFYDAGQGDSVQELEHWFDKHVESRLPVAIDDLVRLSCQHESRRLDPEALGSMLSQLALQFLRTQAMRTAVSGGLRKQALAPGGQAEQIARSIREHLAQSLGVAVTDVQTEITDIDVQMNGVGHLTHILYQRNLDAMVQDLLSFTWCLLLTTPDRPFVTSDAPVVISAAPNAVRQQAGFPVGSVAVYPLTPTTLLRGQKSGQYPEIPTEEGVINVPPELVLNCNRLMFLGPQGQLLGNMEQALLEAIPEQYRHL